jgi:short chain dehydrogenase
MRALVTGAARGIGRAVATRLARDHETLILMDVDSDGLADAAKELAPSAKVEIVVGSVARSEDCRRAAECAVDAGGLDVLSHNAGIQRYGTVETTSEALWDEVISVNLTGAFLISKATMPLIRVQGRGRLHDVHPGVCKSGRRCRLFNGQTWTGRSCPRDGGRRRALWRESQWRRARLRRHPDAAGVDCPCQKPGRRVGGHKGSASAWTGGECRGDRRSRRVSGVLRRLFYHRRGRADRRRRYGAPRRLSQDRVNGPGWSIMMGGKSLEGRKAIAGIGRQTPEDCQEPLSR